MTKYLLALVVLTAASATAQIVSCPANIPAGSTCVQGPVYVISASGATPTTTISFTQATAAFPCPPGVGTAAAPALCLDVTGALTKDSGSGYQSIVTKGDKGDPGVGIPGKDGINGTNATVTIGTTTTLPAGSPATVTNTGTTSAAQFNFGIPQGPPGTGTSLPMTVTITCPPGSGGIQRGWVTKKCVLSK